MSLVSVSLMLVLVCGCAPRPLDEDKEAGIVEFENKNDAFGGYSFYYETTNNLRRKETGQLLNPASENAILVVKGFYSYIGTGGQKYEVQYVADENGFQPQITHSVPPPTNKNVVPFIGSAAVGSLAGGGDKTA